MNTQESVTLAPSLLMQRVAAELSHCQAILRRVEHAVHETVLAPGANTTGPVWQKNMQDLDLLDQSLGDLALCLNSAAQGAALHNTVPLNAIEVLGALRLEHLRHRLKGTSAVPDRIDHIEIF
ncbi:hypothetical protein [Rhodobacter ferrooxidans]|uniref:Uncharacterized protein n=1 Tax=Rhodobacter ferrooxidans TaxID=371731 RepID=C8S4D5_9RHOB|nr:hypothetical protein [Rhodobacter sp. SW2]EEW24194.1 hypothetical protein Rsw2DRAFT_2913 [Rhodobacter sp. SW2]